MNDKIIALRFFFSLLSIGKSLPRPILPVLLSSNLVVGMSWMRRYGCQMFDMVSSGGIDRMKLAIFAARNSIYTVRWVNTLYLNIILNIKRYNYFRFEDVERYKINMYPLNENIFLKLYFLDIASFIYSASKL